jgi:hypothetical protein
MTNHKTTPRFSAKVLERAVRMEFEHRAEHTSQWRRSARSHRNVFGKVATPAFHRRDDLRDHVPYRPYSRD